MARRFYPERHHRRSIRLKGYDYGQAGAYFVTCCTHQRACSFGEVVEGRPILSGYGRVLVAEWERTAELRDYVQLDAYVVMPNHFHGIIWIVRDGRGRCRGTMHRAQEDGTTRRAPTGGSTEERFGKPVVGSLPSIMRAFKGAVTRQLNGMRGTPGAPVWQRNYFEHVIRTERALNAIRGYIADNPARWRLDRYHPSPAGVDPQAAELWRLMQEDAGP